MPNLPPNEGGHADEIFGAAAYEVPLPQKKDFLAWHRPRKQFVRDRQWCSEIIRLLDDIQLEGNVLRYLGLPGVDLLDLRYLHKRVCMPNQLKLRFLGFNKSANPASTEQTELNISLDEVRKLELVDLSSEIIRDDFCRLSNDGSIASRKARELGPFDVVNLDLCDGFGMQRPGMLDDTHYNAVSSLLSLQARSKNPWLLLLTTRSGHEHVHVNVLESFLQKYCQNLESCAEFKDASIRNFSLEDEEGLRAAVGDRNGDGHLKIFLTGLCKWLVGLAIEQNPPSKVKVKSVIGYRVVQHSAHEDLISLALRFEPTFAPVADPMGLANQQANQPNECELAVTALQCIARRKNADTILADNSDLHSEMVAATADLLESARYDVGAFHAWVQA